MKQCQGKCGEFKPITEFNKRKDSVDGHRHECRICYQARLKKLKETPEVLAKREANRIRKVKKEAFEQHVSIARPMYHAAVASRNMSEIYKENKKSYKRDYMKNRRTDPAYREQEREFQHQLRDEGYYKQYNEVNKERLKQKNKEWRQKNKNNPVVKFKKKLRRLTIEALNSNGSPKYKRTLEILDCDSWEEAMEHLEPKIPGTHIDHIIPLAFAEKGNTKELESLSSIWNMRRIPAEENIAKSDSIPSRDLLHPKLSPLALEIYERAVNRHQKRGAA